MRYDFWDWYDHPLQNPTEIQKERRAFAKMKIALQRRKRAKWRLRLALWVAGRRAAKAQQL